MDLTEDQKKEIELESKIRGLLREDNGVDVSFVYRDGFVDLITYNPKHGTYFLLDTVETTKKIKHEILHEILEFLKHKIKPKFCFTYEIKWFFDGKFNISYFTGCSLEEVAKKFYYKNNPHDYIIHQAILKPES